MIKPDWSIFSSKFSENPQENFEWFCYLLICREFDKSYGIFRYKNQAAIETDPISSKNEDLVGWQAKFYDTTLTSNEAEIIKSLEKTKKYYPKVSKFIFLSNKDWTQYKGQPTKAQSRIEKRAGELAIELEWRTASFFESPYVCIKNSDISQFFFSEKKGVFELIDKLRIHTKSILGQIGSTISFQDKSIEIKRDACYKEIDENPLQILILCGGGGVGKTVIVKNLYEQKSGKEPFYVFKATEFELRHIDDLFDGCSVEEFDRAHCDEIQKTVVIDSAEKLMDLRNSDPIKEFLSVLVTSNWKVIFTTRDHYLEDLNYQFFEIYQIVPLKILIEDLELDELVALGDEYTFNLPKDEKLKSLIRNPFYLKEYLAIYEETEADQLFCF